MMKKVPQHLYLYMRNRLDRILDVLLNQRIYFSDPSKFNDPFDCAFGIQFPNPGKLTSKDEADWKEYLIHIGTEGPDSLAPEVSAKKAEQFLKDGKHKNIGIIQEFRKEVRAAIKALGKVMGVLCLSSNPKSAMMWAHYADNHRGIVFKFNTDYMYDKRTNERRCFHVDYEDNFPTLAEYLYAYRASKKGDVIAPNKLFFCRKSKDWERESEWRFFSEPADSLIPFEPSMLDGVIFGWKMEKNIKSILKSCLSSCKRHTKIYSAKPSIDKFEMEIQEYSNK